MDALYHILAVIVALCILVKEAAVGFGRFLASLKSDTKVSDFFCYLLPAHPPAVTKVALKRPHCHCGAPRAAPTHLSCALTPHPSLHCLTATACTWHVTYPTLSLPFCLCSSLQVGEPQSQQLQVQSQGDLTSANASSSASASACATQSVAQSASDAQPEAHALAVPDSSVPAAPAPAGAVPAHSTSQRDSSTQGEESSSVPHHMRMTASRLRAIVTSAASTKRDSSSGSSSPSACNSPRSPGTVAVSLRVAALRAAAAAAERAAARSSSHGASSGSHSASGLTSYWLATSSSSDDDDSDGDYDSECDSASESEGSSPRYLRRTVSDAERRKAQAKERRQRKRATKLFRDRVPEEAVREAVKRRESADKERERVAKELRSLYPDPEQALRAMQEHGRHSAHGHAAGSQWLPATMAGA